MALPLDRASVRFQGLPWWAFLLAVCALTLVRLFQILALPSSCACVAEALLVGGLSLSLSGSQGNSLIHTRGSLPGVLLSGGHPACPTPENLRKPLGWGQHTAYLPEGRAACLPAGRPWSAFQTGSCCPCSSGGKQGTGAIGVDSSCPMAQWNHTPILGAAPIFILRRPPNHRPRKAK